MIYDLLKAAGGKPLYELMRTISSFKAGMREFSLRRCITSVIRKRYHRYCNAHVCILESRPAQQCKYLIVNARSKYDAKRSS